jgi:hypothetical protein
MTKLKAGALGAILLAGVATPLVIHYQSQAKLRDRDVVLHQQNEQIAQLTSENTRLSNLLAQANSPGAQDQMRELAILRGKVGALKSQLAAAEKAQRRNTAAPQTKVEVDPAEQQRQIAIAKLNYTKGWVLAFMQFAEQHQGRFPTSFEEAASFLPDEAKAQASLAADQFEIVYQGSPNEITNANSIIVVREKEAWQTPDGGWARAYSFVDGHSEIHKAIDGNFQPWEQQHLITPLPGSDVAK